MMVKTSLATVTQDLPAAKEEDACRDSDDHEGQDSKDIDSGAPLRVQAGSIRKSAENLCHAGW